MIEPSLRKAALTALSLALVSCGTIKKSMPDIHMPKMPDLSGVKKILPGSDDTVSADDPLVPFNAQGRLARGHTLRLRVYEGAMNSREIFSGLTMVDDRDTAKIGRIGSAKIGGHTLPEAARMIESVFRVGGHAALQIYVHVVSVENVQLVGINGNVRAPQYLPIWANMRFSDAVNRSGGRKSPQGAAVYVTRDGMRKFFSHIGAADAWGSPQAGDIITLSNDL